MWNKIKQLFKEPEPVKKPDLKDHGTKKPRKVPELSQKEKATAAGEPYISIVKVDIDPKDVNNGAFELDWNDKFVINLIKAGYKMREKDTDKTIVDRWFVEVCRNIALEMHEQHIADPKNRNSGDMRNIITRDLGDGRSEVS